MHAWLMAQASEPAKLVLAVTVALTPKPKPGVQPHAKAANAPPRLGRLAEALMDFFVRQSPAMQWEASGVKIFHRNQAGEPTAQQLGELDYLWRDGNGDLVHAELAVKFYALANDSNAGLAGWQQSALAAIGPDGHENWQHKWHKLLHKQLAHDLPTPWADTPVKRIAHVRGRWFVPVQSEAALRHWAGLTNAQPLDWGLLLGSGPWSEACDVRDDVVLGASVFAGNSARFGPRLTWAQARGLALPVAWQCRLLERGEWLGPVSQSSDVHLHQPDALRHPPLPASGHPRVQMLGVFAFDAQANAWCEQWRAWLDAEAPPEITI